MLFKHIYFLFLKHFLQQMVAIYNLHLNLTSCLSYTLSVPLEGLKSQAAFEEMRQNYIRELSRAIHMKEKGMVASSQRFYHLTKLMDAMHDVRLFQKVHLQSVRTY